MASKTIQELSATAAPLAANDLIVIEKGDGSGTKKMTYTELINAISNDVINLNNTTAVQNMSLRQGENISANADLNNYTTAGRYYSSGSAVTSTLSNVPDDVTSGFVLVVENITTSSIKQTIIPAYYSSGFSYERKKSGDNWGNWLRYSGTLSTPFVVKNYAYTYTIAANSAISITGNDFGVSTPSGYAPLAFQKINTRSDFVFPRLSQVSSVGSNALMRLANISSSQQSNACEITIVYVASSWFNGTPLT